MWQNLGALQTTPAGRGVQNSLHKVVVGQPRQKTITIINTRCKCMDNHFRRFLRQILANTFDIVKMVLKATPYNLVIWVDIKSCSSNMMSLGFQLPLQDIHRSTQPQYSMLTFANCYLVPRTKNFVLSSCNIRLSEIIQFRVSLVQSVIELIAISAASSYWLGQWGL